MAKSIPQTHIPVRQFGLDGSLASPGFGDLILGLRYRGTRHESLSIVQHNQPTTHTDIRYNSGAPQTQTPTRRCDDWSPGNRNCDFMSFSGQASVGGFEHR
ncbi:uncharacterized protein LOC108134732 [Drosophila elegans]|uniref:uncharacterized protein LOC108134732 n=1 Tax=Drosophila elegans TaxID=30023 RepID=UPI0007E7FCAD|nr:uncharacterized protein LOC108134732 [Drosophila elegans]